MEHKLEITHKLEKIADTLDGRIAILNLPAANLCEKRDERILVGGQLIQPCVGCITQKVNPLESLPIEKIKEIIDHFAEKYGVQFITINGRGDPFHPSIKAETLEKVQYSYDTWGIQSYIFSAGNNLDAATCAFLADHNVNIILSLLGNRFIDADFFRGKEYPPSEPPLQNEAITALNIRRLISVYRESPHQPEVGTTRLGMNYVVSHVRKYNREIVWSDIADGAKKLKALKEAANENGIFFVVNTPFHPNKDAAIQKQLEEMAYSFSDFHMRHSTIVNGECQMGAGSGATVDSDGMLLRCPYMDNTEGQGRFYDLAQEKRAEIILSYMGDRKYVCVMRKHEKKGESQR